MPKILMIDGTKVTEDMIQNAADKVFETALDMVKTHGVCYMRFTKEDGIELISPKYNQRINGAIADA